MSVKTKPIHINLLHKDAIHELKAHPQWTVQELYESLPEHLSENLNILEISFTEKTLNRNEEIEIFTENKINVKKGNLFDISEQLKNLRLQYQNEKIFLKYEYSSNSLFIIVEEMGLRSICLSDVGIEAGETVLFEIDEKPFCRIIFEGQLYYLALEELQENLQNLRKAQPNIPEEFMVFKNGEEILNVVKIFDGDTLEIFPKILEYGIYCGSRLQKIKIPFRPHFLWSDFKKECLETFILHSTEDPENFSFFVNSKEIEIIDEKNETLHSHGITPKTQLLFFNHLLQKELLSNLQIIFIKIEETGEIIDLKVKPNCSLLRVKFEIENHLNNYPFEKQKLRFRNKNLRNDLKLTDYNIKQFDILNLQLLAEEEKNNNNNKKHNFEKKNLNSNRHEEKNYSNNLNFSENKDKKKYLNHDGDDDNKLFITLEDGEIIDITLVKYASLKGLKAYLQRYEAEKKIAGIAIEFWSIGEVCAWLKTLGFEQYLDSFFLADVDGRFLPLLLKEHEEMFEALGIKIRHRKRMKESIAEKVASSEKNYPQAELKKKKII